ncbi:MAG: suppressor of fused domain protein [Actinobacteria bacterium]|nr:suppressor of fused domain protein [Actinomycetota bacterium]
MPEYRASDPAKAIEKHIRRFFKGHVVTERRWDTGPIYRRVPDFKVWVVAPGPRLNAWKFVSSGCGSATQDHGHGIEFVLSAADGGERNIELMAINAFYHAGPPSQRLDVGHTVPIGEGWTDGSACDHLLVSLPYAYGPDLEICSLGAGNPRGPARSVLPGSRAQRGRWFSSRW